LFGNPILQVFLETVFHLLVFKTEKAKQDKGVLLLNFSVFEKQKHGKECNFH